MYCWIGSKGSNLPMWNLTQEGILGGKASFQFRDFFLSLDITNFYCDVNSGWGKKIKLSNPISEHCDVQSYLPSMKYELPKLLRVL